MWTNRYNGPGNGFDQCYAIAVDGSGSVFVTGVAFITVNSSDYATIKYSGAGVPLWTNYYDGPGNDDDEPRAIAVDSAGNVFVTGRSFDTGYVNPDYATVAYSNAGVPLWTNRYNGSANDEDIPTAIVVDGDGNVFVTGYSDGVRSGSDYVTIKYSSAGVPLWTNRYNGSLNYLDEALAMTVDGDGNVFVTGRSYFASGAFYDYATIKYSGAGVPLWTNRYNGPANDGDWGDAIAVDRNGDVVVTGHSYRSGSSIDYTTIKYSGGGIALWTNRYDGPSNGPDHARTIAVDGDGNVFVTGQSPSGLTLASYDYVTVKYSGEGVPLWTNRYNGPANGFDEPWGMALDGGGNVYVTGAAQGYATIAYSGAGVPLWTNRYTAGYGGDGASAITVDASGNVFVTGSSLGNGRSSDYVMIKYSGASLLPIRLDYQIIGNELVLSWASTTFGLQAPPSVHGTYTNISGATSPYTNSFSGTQQYFRLKGN